MVTSTPDIAGPRTLVGYANGRATREDILQAATALFAQSGYRATSLREIAARAGISHTGLRHHFASKAELLDAVLQRRDAEDRAAVEAATSAGSDVFDELVALVGRNAQHRAMVELYTVVSAEAVAPDHPAHGSFVARYAGVVEAFADALRQRAEQGRLRLGVDPEVEARTIVALMDGLQLQWLLDPGRVDMAAALRAHLAQMFPEG